MSSDAERLSPPLHQEGVARECYENARQEYWAHKKAGRNPRYIVGHVTGVSKTFPTKNKYAPNTDHAAALHHAWVEVGDKIHDATPFKHGEGNFDTNPQRLAHEHWDTVHYKPRHEVPEKHLTQPLKYFPRVDEAAGSRSRSNTKSAPAMEPPRPIRPGSTPRTDAIPSIVSKEKMEYKKAVEQLVLAVGEIEKSVNALQEQTLALKGITPPSHIAFFNDALHSITWASKELNLSGTYLLKVIGVDAQKPTNEASEDRFRDTARPERRFFIKSLANTIKNLEKYEVREMGEDKAATVLRCPETDVFTCSEGDKGGKFIEAVKAWRIRDRPDFKLNFDDKDRDPLPADSPGILPDAMLTGGATSAPGFWGSRTPSEYPRTPASRPKNIEESHDSVGSLAREFGYHQTRDTSSSSIRYMHPSGHILKSSDTGGWEHSIGPSRLKSGTDLKALRTHLEQTHLSASKSTRKVLEDRGFDQITRMSYRAPSGDYCVTVNEQGAWSCRGERGAGASSLQNTLDNLSLFEDMIQAHGAS